MNPITGSSQSVDKKADRLEKTLLGIPEYPERQKLYIELNADAYELLAVPSRLSHLVLLSNRQFVDQEYALITKLCEYYGAIPPSVDIHHLSVELGEFRLRWERHTEYSTYTVYTSKPFKTPFAQAAIELLPNDWIASIPGKILVATHIVLEDRARPNRSLSELADLFSSNTIIGSKVAAGNASVWSDSQVHSDGFGRILIHDNKLQSRQVGRLVQRLLEIETYRMLAMLPVPMTKKMIPDLAQYDQRLATLIANQAESTGIEDEQLLLDDLAKLAAEIERKLAQSSHRFNASRAYYEIVKLRITELREKRIEGLQMLQEFMGQRLSSSMGTCNLVHTKLETLSIRVSRASALLRTRVDISMEAQIRDLLKSMNTRAHVQLRLQETVESLSVVVLSYYLLGILGYGLKASKATGLNINVELLTGIAIPFIIAGVFFAVKSLRKNVEKLQHDKD